MKTFPKLYKKTKTGATQVWQIFVDGDSFYTRSGQLDGAIVESARTVCEGKNIGKSNETSPESQAEAEALARWTKKTEGAYKESIDDIEDGTSYFECTLAKKYNDRKDKIVWPALASKKIDGLRMVNTKGSTITRNGKDIVSCPHIQNALIPFFQKYPKGVVDGEIYAANEFFEDVVGIVKKLKPTSEDLAESEKKAQLWVFDGIIDDPDEGFSKRFEAVKKGILSTVAKENLKYFVFVENTVVNNHEEFIAEHDKYVEQGFEGAMLRWPDSPYEHGRTANLLKLKNFLDEEFEIVDFLEGKGNDAGKASKVIVKVGKEDTSEAGIRGSDAYAAKLLKDRKKYIGKKATVRYQGWTKYGKLRFGVAVSVDPIDR